jgi:quercetin dioxygenase-like cupin family protein
MKRLIIISLFQFVLFQHGYAIEPVYSTTLAKDTRSWDGGGFQYPDGMAQIVVQKITITPGDEALLLPEHCHPVPLAAYVLKGSVHVEEPSGQYHIFSEGDAFIEVMNTWHKGKFVEDTELIAFYAGSEGVPLSVKVNASSEYSNQCK